MSFSTFAPWAVLLGYMFVTWLAVPGRVSTAQFYSGENAAGKPPGVWLLAASAAISWIFAKSIVNSSNLAYAFGLAGGIGYTIYYLSFGVAGVAIYLLRTRGGYHSLPHFLVEKYGRTCAKLFLLAIGFRLFNEIWSNTKVIGLYFGPEGSRDYWLSIGAVTLFTLKYTWSGGMRASLLTDRVQAILNFALLGVVLTLLFPDLQAKGLAPVPDATRDAGITFCLLALVQVASYPFHDPVLTDRAFLTPPKQMLKSFVIAGVLSGGFIFLFSIIGLYGRAFGLGPNPAVAVPGALGLVMLMLFNGIMLLSAGSVMDSTFTSVAKMAARDWRGDYAEPDRPHLRTGRIAVVAVAVLGNLPLLTIYLGDKIGPAVIAATTISGTMVMGLAPIFLLSWVRPAGALSFHLAFWPGIVFGVLRSVETFAKVEIFPAGLTLGSGKYALDLGVNAYGLALCTAGYLVGAALAAREGRLAAARG